MRLVDGVPIVLGLLDHRKKVGGLFEAVYAAGDLKADMDKILAFYSNRPLCDSSCVHPAACMLRPDDLNADNEQTN